MYMHQRPQNRKFTPVNNCIAYTKGGEFVMYKFDRSPFCFVDKNIKVKQVKQMIYIAVLYNSRITAEPLYNTPLFIGPYAAANNTALLA